MLNLLINNYHILSTNFRRRLYFFFILLILTIFFESLGIIVLFQSVNIFFNSSDSIIANSYLYSLFNFVEIDIIKNKYFLFSLVILLYLFKTLFLTFFSWWKNKFIIDMRKNIGERFYKKYMFESHSYHVGKNTSEFVRNITLDNEQFTFSILQSISLITEIMVVIFLGAILFYLQPFLTFLFCLIFFIFSLGWYLSLKKKLNTWGKKRQFHDGKMLKFINEGFRGHKEIKILGVENFFI